MPGRSPTHVVGIGASAGGVEALTRVFAALPHDLDAAVVVVLHLPAEGRSVLAKLLDRAGPLPVEAVTDSPPLEAGRGYVATAGLHLLLTDGGLMTSAGPREHGLRPAIDPTFRGIADLWRGAGVGVLLSGTRDDGVLGLQRIRARGGTVLVQDPEDCMFGGLPRAAMAALDLEPGAVLPAEALAARIAELARENDPPPEEHEVTPPDQSPDDAAEPTKFTCIECGGVLLNEEEDGGALVLRCSVGHAYSPETFDEEHARRIESTLWTATRLFFDRANLMDGMADQADGRGHHSSAERFRTAAGDARRHERLLRELVEGYSRSNGVA